MIKRRFNRHFVCRPRTSYDLITGMGEFFSTCSEQLLGSVSIKEIKATLLSAKLLFAGKVIHGGMFGNIESPLPMPHDSKS